MATQGALSVARAQTARCVRAGAPGASGGNHFGVVCGHVGGTALRQAFVGVIEFDFGRKPAPLPEEGIGQATLQ